MKTTKTFFRMKTEGPVDATPELISKNYSADRVYSVYTFARLRMTQLTIRDAKAWDSCRESHNVIGKNLDRKNLLLIAFNNSRLLSPKSIYQ